MFLCINCGNHKQLQKYVITGCQKWLYYITCNCCKKTYNYKYLFKHLLISIHIT